MESRAQGSVHALGQVSTYVDPASNKVANRDLKTSKTEPMVKMSTEVRFEFEGLEIGAVFEAELAKECSCQVDPSCHPS